MTREQTFTRFNINSGIDDFNPSTYADEVVAEVYRLRQELTDQYPGKNIGSEISQVYLDAQRKLGRVAWKIHEPPAVRRFKTTQ